MDQDEFEEKDFSLGDDEEDDVTEGDEDILAHGFTEIDPFEPREPEQDY